MRMFFIFSICDILIYRPLEPPFYISRKHVPRNRVWYLLTKVGESHHLLYSLGSGGSPLKRATGSPQIGRPKHYNLLFFCKFSLVPALVGRVGISKRQIQCHSEAAINSGNQVNVLDPADSEEKVLLKRKCLRRENVPRGNDMWGQ